MWVDVSFRGIEDSHSDSLTYASGRLHQLRLSHRIGPSSPIHGLPLNPDTAYPNRGPLHKPRVMEFFKGGPQGGLQDHIIP